MKLLLVIFLLVVSLASCQSNSTSEEPQNPAVSDTKNTEDVAWIIPDGATVKTRFNTPEGFQRVTLDSNSFGFFLQELPLKKDGSPVILHNGALKDNQKTHLAVVDWPIYGSENHECADAVMRLRAQFLYNQKRYDEINFFKNSRNGRSYIKDLNGRTPTPENLWKHLLYVFAYAGTASLEPQLKPKEIKDLAVGDVFIKGGDPGHVVIIVDKCTNSEGKVKFMIAQSFMPAQEIEILNGQEDGNPWYDADFGENLMTYEYPFQKNNLKSFE